MQSGILAEIAYCIVLSVQTGGISVCLFVVVVVLFVFVF